jgi:tetratricopeptide (TPR) repeat protein/4-amino-4-deoxy-L-arabinose transferase-like glycosyltransferase
VWQIRRAPFFTVLVGDSRAYDEWAQRIARGDWLGHEVFYQAPLYPYLLGALYAIAGRNLLIVRIVQAIVGSAACVLLALAGWRFFSKRVGVVAGVVLALYAPAIFFDGLIQKSVLDVFFICLTVWLLGNLVEEPKRRLSWLWLGMAAGALSLTRENALVLAGVIVLWACSRNAARPYRARLADAATIVLGLGLVLLPVAVRNGMVGGGFVLTTSQFGPNLYIGNNPRADGTYMPLRLGRGAPEYERQDATDLAEQASGGTLTPAEVSRYWTDRALDFITSQPRDWLKLVGRKVALVWNAGEMLDSESQESHAEWSTPVRLGAHAGHFGVIVPLALLGVWATWPQRKRLWILYAMSMAYAASVVMFYVFARYRFPLVPFLVLFASAGLSSIPRLVRETPPAQAARVAVAVSAVAVFVNWPILSADRMQAISDTNLAAALQSEGRLDEAIDRYRRAIVHKTDYAPAYNNMGTALRANGKLGAAIAAYHRALLLQPDFADAHYNLANAFFAEQKMDAAIDHFTRAMQSVPGTVDVHNNLGVALAATGRSDAAIVQFQEALRLDPASAKTHRNLGNALASRGATADALDHLQRAAQLDPGDGQGRYDLGSALLEARRFSDAVDQFRAALELTPDSVEAHNNMGIALASQGRLDEAIDQFQEALRLRPQFEQAQQNLTMAVQARRQPGGRRE